MPVSHLLHFLALALLFVTQVTIGTIGFLPVLLGHAEGHGDSTALFAFASTPPEIDGVIQDSEWASAAKLDIVMSNSGYDIPATIKVMNDANNLYMALEVEDDASIDVGILQIRFDDNHDGLLDPEEDVFHYDPKSPTNFDSFLAAVEEFPDEIEYDSIVGGVLDGVVAASKGTSINSYEFSHPLCSSDITHDFCLTSGSSVGFSLLYFIQVESAAWPPSVTEGSDASSFADIIISELPASSDIYLGDFRPDRGLGSNYAPGDSITLFLDVENKGSKVVDKNCMAVDMGAFFPDRKVFFEYHIENLTEINPGDTETFAYHFQIPINASSGSFDIMASVSIVGESCGGSYEEEISHAAAFNVEANCLLPEGTVVGVEDELPDYYHSITFSSSEIGVKSLPDPILPVASIFSGTNINDASGLLLHFSIDGLEYSCPIYPQMISIEFSEDNLMMTNVRIENVGIFDDNSTRTVAAYVNYGNHKFMQLPIDTSIKVNESAPDEIYEISFDIDDPRTVTVPLPESEVRGIWVAASDMVQEPYLYFRTFGEWFARPIEQSWNTLTFESDTNLSDVVVAADDVLDRGNVTIGYIYPIELIANAGSDQVVAELQRVYLDGTRSEGPGIGLTYTWKQMAGPTVILNNANTATANFVSPAGTLGAAELDLRFQLTLKDSTGNVDTDTVVITLQPKGQSPVVFAGYDMTVDSETKISLNGFVWDSDNKLSDVTLRWTQVSGMAVVLQNSTTLNPSFVTPDLRVSEELDLEFALVAEDVNHNTATAHVTIHVIGKKSESTGPPTTPPPSTTPTTPPPAPASDIAANTDLGFVSIVINPITKVANDNPILFLTILIVIPSGISVAVITALRRKGSSRINTLLNVKAASLLFPDSDPVADEYEATRPFIEALENELGTKLDTATSISDLLEKFSGRKQVDSE